jgi:hypothetical protein
MEDWKLVEAAKEEAAGSGGGGVEEEVRAAHEVETSIRCLWKVVREKRSKEGNFAQRLL